MQSDGTADAELIVRLYRAIFAGVGNRPDAESLTTDALTRALPGLRSAATLDECHRILDSTAAAAISGHWGRCVGKAGARVAGWAQRGVEGSDGGREPNDVERALAELPTDQRNVLELRFMAGRSLEEAARRMQIPVREARMLQYTGLRRFGELTQLAASQRLTG
jgi:RNA polymerase sigma-70 factor (ECF subfamily)